jgi:Stress-induced bacterial acidophilic repeat motif
MVSGLMLWQLAATSVQSPRASCNENEHSPAGGIPMPLKRSKPASAQSKAITASGDQCKAKPHKDSLCFFHSDPQRAAELGRKGGRRKATIRPDDLQELAAPKTPADLKHLMAQSIVELRARKLDPKVANAISYLGAGFLRAHEVSDLETRLQALEARAGDPDAKSQRQD